MGAKRVTKEAFLERANTIHNGKYNYSKVDWVDTRHKIKIICPIHGVFEQQGYKHLAGQGCPDCRKNATVTQDEFIARAKQMHPNEHYDYSRVQYHNMWTPVEIICPVHGSFFQTPAKHVKTGKSGNAQGCPKCRYIRQRKTNMARYGVESPMRVKEFVDKCWETTKKNGNACSSKPETQMYKILCERFGVDDVKRNYNKDARYPFHCDFYIASLDLFIELNANWTHGLHWFDPNSKEDAAKLNLWTERSEINSSRAYKSAIHTWTVRDPLKRQIAIDNNLNYLVFWNSDLTDFKTWLSTFSHKS